MAGARADSGPGNTDNGKERGKKQILLRVSNSLWKELAAWAEDDFRSINGQIEFLLTECVKKRRKNASREPAEESDLDDDN